MLAGGQGFGLLQGSRVAQWHSHSNCMLDFYTQVDTTYVMNLIFVILSRSLGFVFVRSSNLLDVRKAAILFIENVMNNKQQIYQRNIDSIPRLVS